MSPEMLVQPFEQSLSIVPMSNGYYPRHQHGYYHAFNGPVTTATVSTNAEGHDNSPNTSIYFTPLGYMQQQHQPLIIDSMEDFRATFYNPFEIKHRRRTSRAQLKVLEKSFSENPKPNATVRRLLAQQLDMTPRGVQIWFQNRRAKAKLQRRKSGGGNGNQGAVSEKESQQQQQQQQHQQHQQQPTTASDFNTIGLQTPEMSSKSDRRLYQSSQDISNYYGQFFDKSKFWDNSNGNSARSIATAAAASCVYNNNANNSNNADHQHASIGMEEWIKMPLHPLAPVINTEQPQQHPSDSLSQQQPSYDIDTEDWRRKSCPAIQTTATAWPTTTHIQRYQQYELMNTSNQSNNDNRRLTADNTSTHILHNTAPLTSHMEMYSSSSSNNINYSPVSQQLTPILSTGSPVSSVDGNYYDPRLEMLMVSSASTSSSTATI